MIFGTKKDSIIEKLNHKEDDSFYYKSLIFCSLILSVVIFIPFVFRDHGYFAIAHDFIASCIPHEIFLINEVKNGNFLWNWGIDIGTNVLETTSGLINNPFFLLECFFPKNWFIFLIPYFVILKIVFTNIFSGMYFKRHLSLYPALIASLLYSFSGFQIGTIWFYSFRDFILFFPLMIWALEKLIEERKYGYFAIVCAINASINFSTFVSETLFTIIYFIFKYLISDLSKKEYKKILINVSLCIFEGIIGGCLVAFSIIPVILYLSDNPRASNYILGNSWFTITTHDILNFIKAFFMPPEPECRLGSVDWADWMSKEVWLPFFGMTFVFSYMMKQKGWLKNLLVGMIAFVIFPVLSTSFYGFAAANYRRWYFMLALVMGLATGKVLEDINSYKKEIKISMIICLVIYFIFFILTKIVRWDYNNTNLIFSYRKYIFTLSIGIITTIMTFIFSQQTGNRQKIAFLLGVSISVVMSFTFYIYSFQRNIDNTGIIFYRNGSYSDHAVKAVTEITKDMNSDILPFRYEFDEGIGYTYYNYSLVNSLPATGAFSNVSNSIFKFYERIGYPKTSAMTMNGPNGKRDLFSARYVCSLNPLSSPNYKYLYTLENSEGFKFYVYENEDAVPIGFTYDTYMKFSDFQNIPNYDRCIAMLNTLVINDEDESLVKEYLPYFDKERGFKSIEEAVKDRKVESSYKFTVGNNFFVSNIQADSEKFAFFSVPHDKYWNAKVNGKSVKIIDINGLMAVKIEKGENKIEFFYDYKPLKMGLLISLSGIIFLLLYMLAVKVDMRKIIKKPAVFTCIVILFCAIANICVHILINRNNITIWNKNENVEIAKNSKHKIYDKRLSENLSLKDYLKRLNDEKDKISIFLTVCDGVYEKLPDDVKFYMEKLGMTINCLQDGRKSYIFISDKGSVLYENISAEKIIKDGELNNIKFHLESACWVSGNYCSMIINDQQYINKWYRGLNFVIYDNETQKVVDYVAYDTLLDEMPALR